MKNNWEQLLNDNIQSLEDLKSKGVPVNEPNEIASIINRHPMNIPQYYFELIDSQDKNDPIRKMSVPDELELQTEGQDDTSGEQENTVLPGLQHKYKETALVLTTNKCYMYCRHCFRKRMVGYTQKEIMERMKEAIDYISHHKEISNVLLSGGDSFTLSNDIIKEYLENLTKIEHLDFIRFGTRVPVVFPMRISLDKELLEILQYYNKKKRIIVVTQFNHPNELNEKSIESIEALRSINIDVLNQTVLLKDINDDADTLSSLLKGLITNRIVPYYVFQCRPVKHVKNNFQVSFLKGIDVINETRSRLNGPSKNFKYALSHPRGKIEILGKEENKVFFKFHQSKDLSDANKIFSVDVLDKHSWLDNELNPIS
ncbi:KamA family radical SAM protein [Alkalibaculum sp. M08DMB]|uniref:KamA family radical SAM protein n=1 Tax=Alkalibaculum sporogenes TaxID=2655001 RepID=A0A6A7KBY0_9FIRM|nr:KamA family radical SAM protein [Alkalibaculum sporogenes]MPW26924.1 KamA family radical SAM protein [Alkalibaculum sporogenes]